MKILKLLLITTAVVALAATAVAQCPVSGWYQTQNNSLYPGRVSEAWCGANGNPVAPGQVGNTQNTMSWSAQTLGAMWTMEGMAIADPGPVLVYDGLDVDGNGYQDYNTDYVGGTFFMDKDYPWGANTAVDMVGTVSYYNVASRVSYQNFEVTGVEANLFMQGTFDECVDQFGAPRCFIELTLANASLVWRADWAAPMPGDYPPYLCGADMGELYYACCITTVISCDGVATESTDWGSLKSMYR